MTVGVLAHLFGKLPYRELAAKVGAAGFTHVQLAPWRAISDVDFNKPGKFSPGLALSIAEEFRRAWSIHIGARVLSAFFCTG
ncbi:hypothetical protein QOZ95_003553 [Paenibacillus brasilensis]|uniref:Sugar phosphate isomerase/epimerase n=1 Tax=Paenibacillus brasilensis TaxID=128574 RepID=A0ABU0L1G0_9BACL|nr:hypothetical protein [Paenibacillus brasilensis]MDQ0495374.1 hypothetical protein [Paenibacillus brasilensis]